MFIRKIICGSCLAGPIALLDQQTDDNQSFSIAQANFVRNCFLMNKIPLFIVIPGYQNSGPAHWQTRWQARYANTVRVEQADWESPVMADWVATLDDTIRRVHQSTEQPLVVVAHSLGCITLVHWASRLGSAAANLVKAAYLVAPADVERVDAPAAIQHFSPIPLTRLPFPACAVASGNDPYCRLERAQQFCQAWSARLIDAGALGHINSQSNLGDWDEGKLWLDEWLAGLN